MAYWHEKTVKGRKYVFVYYHRDGRPVQLKPRRLYAHLDAATDDARDTYVRQVAAQYEGRVKTPDHILFSDDKIAKRLDEYRAFLVRTKGRSEDTADKHRSLLLRNVVPYFLSQEPPLKDPAQWAGVSIRLLDWLQDRRLRCLDGTEGPLAASSIREVNNALRSFWKWLGEEGLVSGAQLMLRSPPTGEDDDETPLEFTVAPEEVLEFVEKKAKTRETRLMALLGYFFSLRPQELFALRSSDFAAGEQVRSLGCSLAMRGAGLYSRLAVEVSRQRTAKGRTKTPKAHSRGWVSCFDERAAKAIVAIVNEIPPDAPLFEGFDNRRLYRLWKDWSVPFQSWTGCNINPNGTRGLL